MGLELMRLNERRDWSKKRLNERRDWKVIGIKNKNKKFL